MSLLSRILIKSKYRQVIELLSDSINKSVNIDDTIEGINIFSRRTNGFDFSRDQVELSFKVNVLDNEIQNKFETKPEETKNWLIKLGYKKTQDLIPEKYFKIYNL